MEKTNSALDRAIALTQLDPKTSANTNNAEVVGTLKREFNLSDFKARNLAAQAARRKRYIDFVKPNLTPDKIFLTPSTAARESKFSYARIVRACELGEIANAWQPDSRHWQFTLAAFNAWESDPRYHTRGRKKKAGSK